VSYFGGVFTAMLLYVLSRTSALEAFIFVAPLPVILYVSLRHVQGRAEDQISHLAKMNKVYIATIEALAQAVDAKDQVTHDHIRRVQENALRLARFLGVTDDGQMQALKAASLLHDIGKIAIPEHILNKPGRLNDAEFEIMKRHAAIGADILAVIGFPYPLVPIVRHHHENWDGTGYPDRLAGEQIPIGARILQVVDCYDALTSDRPYRPRMENAEALKIISDRSGTMYDPRVVDALLALVTSGVLDRTGDDAAPALKTPELPKTPEAALEQVDERLALEAFFDLGRTLGGPTPAAGIGDAVWSMVRDHVPASAFLLLQYDPARDALVPAYAAGERAIAPSTHVALGDRLSGWVAAARQTIVNSDARLDLDAAVRDASPLRSALAVPVVRDGQLLGVIAFYSRRENAFQERHTRLAEAAAYAAATRLHTVARQRNAIAV
jgi:putative nucleotidyltransferase with HDIG domain